MIKRCFGLLLACCWGFSGNALAQEAATEQIVLKTSLGEVQLAFLPQAPAPVVAHFKAMVARNAYDGTLIHRVIKGFVAYGGDPLSRDAGQAARWGTGGFKGGIPTVATEDTHAVGVLTMVTRGNPKTIGTQFALCLGPASRLDRRYVPLARLVTGEAVLKAISRTPVKAIPSGERSRPITPITIESVRLVSP